ncbi:hypothetical protein HON22_01470 [Candidatus Peregrinibacteria bacterium]|jgi:glutaredoxin 3|nr:hypothetical protein [Candidatus Peregrinibacteria bacterium]
MGESEVVCHCIGVCKKTLKKEISQGADSLVKLKKVLNVASTCKHCVPDIQQLLNKRRCNISLKPNSSSMLILYTKGGCPYCSQAKELLSSLGIPFKDIDVSHDSETFNEVSLRSGMHTVPQIFMGDACLGGCSEIESLHAQGKLLKMYKNFKAESQ